MFCYCFLFIFNDFGLTNYLNIYRTNFRKIYWVGRTIAVDDQSEISFRSLKRRDVATDLCWHYPQN